MALISIANERELIDQVASGDEKAFEQVFYAYSNPLAAFIYRLVESRELTEEIVQDIFIEIWLKRNALKDIKDFKSYLFVFAKNKSLNALRKKANEYVKHAVWGEEIEWYSYQKVEENTRDQYSLMLDEAITKLPPQQQKVFKMSKMEHLKQEEIAKQLHLAPETVKKHMKLALKFLKSYLRTKIDFPIVVVLLNTFIQHLKK